MSVTLRLDGVALRRLEPAAHCLRCACALQVRPASGLCVYCYARWTTEFPAARGAVPLAVAVESQ